MNKVHPGCDVDCEDCLMNPQVCGKLKASIQELIDQKVVIVEQLAIVDEIATLEIPYDLTHVPIKIPYDPIPILVTSYPIMPLVITVPSPFSFNSTKAVPRNYDSKCYIYDQEVKEEQIESKEASVNITGAEGITRSGSVFALTPSSDNNNQGSSSKNRF